MTISSYSCSLLLRAGLCHSAERVCRGFMLHAKQDKPIEQHALKDAEQGITRAWQGKIAKGTVSTQYAFSPCFSLLCTGLLVLLLLPDKNTCGARNCTLSKVLSLKRLGHS